MRMHHVKYKSAFTMLELIFVIIVLGIVASIGSQIIVQVYESYIVQRALHRTSIKTELAATQLANRLAYSIPNIVIGRKVDNTFRAIDDIPIGTTDYLTLEWIGYDADSFGAVTASTNAGKRPVWSGYCDVNASTIDQIKTPGSRLSELGTTGIISNLSPGTTDIANAAILFPGATAYTVGFNSNIDNIHPVSGQSADDTLDLDAKASRNIKEHYKLSWTAYAVVPVPVTGTNLTGRGFKSTDTIWDLTLRYDYQPWDGNTFANGQSVILIRNVSVFKFTGSGNTIRFKICQREYIGEEYSINTCKEKAVIR